MAVERAATLKTFLCPHSPRKFRWDSTNWMPLILRFGKASADKAMIAAGKDDPIRKGQNGGANEAEKKPVELGETGVSFWLSTSRIT